MIERPWTEPYYSVASDPQRFEDGLKVHNDKPAKVKKVYYCQILISLRCPIFVGTILDKTQEIERPWTKPYYNSVASGSETIRGWVKSP